MHPRSNFRLDILIFKSFDYLQKTRWQSFDKIFVMPYVLGCTRWCCTSCPRGWRTSPWPAWARSPSRCGCVTRCRGGCGAWSTSPHTRWDRYLDVQVVIQWCIYCQGSQFLQNVQFCYPELCLGILLFKRKFALNYSFIKLCAEYKWIPSAADDPFGETDCSTHGIDNNLLYCVNG